MMSSISTADAAAVQRTNDDASACKRSAVDIGYWVDPYLAEMVAGPPPGPGRTRAHPVPRKTPEIHLGYFTRVRGIWHLLDWAASICCPREGFQVVNLGAGYDTLYWRLKDHLKAEHGGGGSGDLAPGSPRGGDRGGGHSSLLRNFVDVDLPEVAANKCRIVRRSQKLLGQISNTEDDEVRFNSAGTDLHGTDYHIVGCDFTDTESLEQKLAECRVSYNLPTVFVSECVFVYLEPSRTVDFLKWARSKWQSQPSASLVLLNHEQLNMNDRFGTIMMDNLSQRGCRMPGVPACQTKETQVSRLVTESGWSGATCWTMNEIYRLLPRDEVARAERLELLDERELVDQLFDHYCITLGWINGSNLTMDDLDPWTT